MKRDRPSLLNLDLMKVKVIFAVGLCSEASYWQCFCTAFPRRVRWNEFNEGRKIRWRLVDVKRVFHASELNLIFITVAQSLLGTGICECRLSAGTSWI